VVAFLLLLSLVV